MNPAAREHAIRRMTAKDLDRVMEIARSLRQAPQWPRRAFAAALISGTAPRRIALVAEDAATGAVAGFGVASFTPPEAELETIAVAAEFQRRGVARHIFEEMAAALGREQVSEIALEVRASNFRAEAFYNALGFAQAGHRPRYYADPVEDAVLMRLRLR